MPTRPMAASRMRFIAWLQRRHRPWRS
jgi:hypothetical protein